MEAKAPTVSIIIPVYNVEKFLRKCLTSLVEQTFQDREIIAVNDGSTDHSLDILREFEQKYDFITVIDQKNRGMSKARNRGLSPPAGNISVLSTATITLRPTSWSVCTTPV